MAVRGSWEWKRNISKGKKRNYSPGPRYWLGKKHDEQYKKEMANTLSGDKNPRYGMKLSNDLKEKIGISINKYYEQHGTKHISKPKTNNRTLFQAGNKHWNWRGGVTNFYRLIRASQKYKYWRDAVFIRDDYTCQGCGERGGKLNADHIKSFSLYPALRFDIENGRTLCINCHKLTNNYGGRSKKLL